ncbi:hypothetical protein CAPN007_07420 [Capnocytophaga canimorsus]|nr:hypothetical protein CAPN007_07420 [Capnocytophaga canimorsus]
MIFVSKNQFMKKIFYAIGIISFLGLGQVQAQEATPIFYEQNLNVFNPAMVGLESAHTISVAIRNQWRGVQDAPQTHTFLTTHRINDRMGVGLSLVNDKIFLLKQAGLYADFSYRLPIDETSDVHLGLKAGGDFFNFDAHRAKVYDDFRYDPYLQTISGKFQPNIGVGVVYKNNRIEVGFALPNLLASDSSKLEDGVMTSVAQRLQTYLHAGYLWQLNTDFALKPIMLSRFAKGFTSSYHFTLWGIYLKKNQLGITYRTDKALSAQLLFEIPQLSVSLGYGYEYPLDTHLNTYARNSHEFLVQFRW